MRVGLAKYFLICFLLLASAKGRSFAQDATVPSATRVDGCTARTICPAKLDTALFGDVLLRFVRLAAKPRSETKMETRRGSSHLGFFRSQIFERHPIV